MSATIVLYVPGASDEEIERGTQVAIAVLEKFKVTPEFALECLELRRRFNSSELPQVAPDDATLKAWWVYDEARWAAINACREGANDAPGWLFEIANSALTKH